jgi:hypothetical protein
MARPITLFAPVTTATSACVLAIVQIASLPRAL